MSSQTKRVILGILDGWGVGPVWGGNAISQANTPNFNFLWNRFPHTVLRASGGAVGLPGNEMGNSEVGHLTIGAGRVIPQDASRINQEIASRRFFHNPVLLDTIRYCQAKHQPLHILGLLTQANVHASLSHLWALLDFCRLNNFHNVFLHLITDGRDSPPQSALELLEKISARFKTAYPVLPGAGESKAVSWLSNKIASVCGRWFAMDRDNHWDRTRQAFEMLTQGKGVQAKSPGQAMADSYKQGLGDEFIPPTNITKNHLPIALIQPRQGVIFFNFRQDRVRQLSRLLVKKVPLLKFISFVPYQMLDLPRQIQPCFKMPEIKNHLAQILSDRKMSQIHIAETEKFAPVSYFFNAGSSQPLPAEKRVLIDSFPADTFDQYPQMKGAEVAEAVVKSLRQRPDFILFNFANADMVGHSGKMESIIAAVEAIDQELDKIFQASQKTDYQLILTADHGNAEEMVNRATGEPHTEHTANLVPFILAHSPDFTISRLKSGAGLADIAPTILDIMGIERPREMSGKSFLIS